MRRLRNLLRIARWEVGKNADGVDRRTVVIVLVGIALFGAVAPLVASGGTALDDDLYRVGVEESSPYYDVVEGDETFLVREGATTADIDRGTVEILITADRFVVADTRKGAAAYEEFRESVQLYNNQQLLGEANQTAAFPVEVTVQFRERETPGADPQTDGTVDPSTDDDPAGIDDEPTGTDEDADPSGPDDGTGAGEETDQDEEGTEPDGEGTAQEAGSIGGASAPLSDDEISGSPADITPPFPFQSLILAFIFVIPLNFLIQAYGSTILSERLNRRGELLLVSPVSRLDIIGGKTLPYFAGAMVLEGIIAVSLVYIARGELGGLLSTFAVMPLVLLFLGSTFLAAMFARSFKELTFLTVTITVVLTSYAFVPAIFTDAGSLALISPLTLVVMELQGEAISLSEVVFSTLPPTLTAFVFFGLGAGLYREEDMFNQRSIPNKVLDALSVPISRPFHVGLMTVVLIPFVFVLQLLAISLLFAVGEVSPAVATVLILGVVAVVEEVAKSLHIYGAYEHNRFDRRTRVAIVLGIASGVGFFLGEKIALLAQLVGLPELAIAEAGLMGGIVEGPIVLLFLLAPLLLHIVTAAISAVGASRGKRAYLLALTTAIVVHFVYNFTIIYSVSEGITGA